jgi:hypothetical protein
LLLEDEVLLFLLVLFLKLDLGNCCEIDVVDIATDDAWDDEVATAEVADTFDGNVLDATPEY